jgi:hypothetical protein
MSDCHGAVDRSLSLDVTKSSVLILFPKDSEFTFEYCCKLPIPSPASALLEDRVNTFATGKIIEHRNFFCRGSELPPAFLLAGCWRLCSLQL